MPEDPPSPRVTLRGKDHLVKDLLQEGRPDGTYLVRRRSDGAGGDPVDIVIEPVPGVEVVVP